MNPVVITRCAVALAACSLGLLVAAAPASGAATFSGPFPLPVSGFFGDVGDFNGDGNVDVAVAQFAASSNVVIMNGNGFGGFTNVLTLSAGNNPDDVIVGDFNGDGKPDLAVPNFSSADVSMFANTTATAGGVPSFAAPVNFGAGGTARNGDGADFDGDGNLDVAVGNHVANKFSVMLGNGAGGLGAPAPFAAQNNTQKVAAVNLNGDVLPDIAAVNSSTGSVSTRLNTSTPGNLGFGASTDTPTGLGARGVGGGDLNKDGDGDVLVGNEGANSLTVLLGNGDNTFQPPTNLQLPGPGYQPVVEDFDADGNADVAVASNPVVSYFGGHGNGTFDPRIDLGAGGVSFAIHAVDVNNDGKPDIVTDRAVFLNTSAGAAPPTGGGNTSTGVACNRGPDPGDPWTCHVGVIDRGGPTATTPGGTVKVTSEQGSTFPAGDTCALAASATNPALSECTVTLNQTPGVGTTVTGGYRADDGVHAPSAGTFTIRGSGDYIVCGPAPLPACPPGQPPPQVCVTIWTSICPGLPPPDLPEICVGLWEDCDEFGRPPGSIDVPPTAPVDCPRPQPSAARELPGIGGCTGTGYIATPSPIRNRAEYNRLTREFRVVVGFARRGTSGNTQFPHSLQQVIDGLLRIGSYDSFGQFIKEMLETEADVVENCVREPGRPATACIGTTSAALTFECTEIGEHGAAAGTEQQARCADAVASYLAFQNSVVYRLQAIKKSYGIDRPFRGNSRALRAQRTKALRPILAGEYALAEGQQGKLKLKPTKVGRKILKTLRKQGVRTVNAVAVTDTETLPGLEPATDQAKVKLRIAK